MKKITLSEFLVRSIQIHNNRYDYSLVKFENNDSIIEIVCHKHGIFRQRLASHLDGCGCRKCVNFDKSIDSEFINRSNKIFNSKYDYSLVEYKNLNSKVKIICPTHGIFEKRPKAHLKGEGCKKCKYGTESFIDKSRIVHSNRYDYSRVIYKSAIEFVKIICPIHGEFEQKPQLHLRGNGCQRCGKNITKDEFLKRSKLIHNNKYVVLEFSDLKNKAVFICPTHGEFKQNPSDHLKGHGCASCGFEISVSKNEVKWLDSLNIKNEFRQFPINKYIVDGFDPETKIVYEFDGDFWHGNPNFFEADDINPISKKTFGRLYKNTINKRKFLESLGYKVVSIWESDYKQSNLSENKIII